MHVLTSTADLDAVLAAPVAIVYKHSTRCPISSMAMTEIESLLAQRPDAPVHVIDVIGSRALSRLAEERLGVVHHSPQAIVLVGGRTVWSGSHFEVRAQTLAERLDAADRTDGADTDDVAPQRRAS